MAKANPFRFSTKYQDDETDLLYYGYRYYNASTREMAKQGPNPGKAEAKIFMGLFETFPLIPSILSDSYVSALRQ